MRKDVISDLDIGRAAEHLVVADLILSGYQAYLTEQGLPYDVVLDDGDTLYRVQVKSTLKPMNARKAGYRGDGVYWFNVRHGKKESGHRRGYTSEFEILALVALDLRIIAYVPACGRIAQTMRLQPPGYTESPAARSRGWGYTRRAKAINQFPVETAIAALTGIRPVLSPRPRTLHLVLPEQPPLFAMETMS